MARIKKELTELIGGTPLLELSRLSKKHDAKAQIIAKLEYFNPGGSVKDRIALAMIEDAEAKGILKPGAVIIEPTSGNTGVGLAWVASVKGYKAILTMPETMSEERQNLLKAMGAQLVLTEGAKGMKGAIEKAEELRDRTPGAVILGQFENPANPARPCTYHCTGNMERHGRKGRHLCCRSRYRRHFKRSSGRIKKTESPYTDCSCRAG